MTTPIFGALLAISFGLSWGFRYFVQRARNRQIRVLAHRSYQKEVNHGVSSLQKAGHAGLDACADKLFR